MLGPQGFNQQRVPGLEPFAEIAAATPQKQILGDLLRNRGAATHALALDVVGISLFDGHHIKAVMLGQRFQQAEIIDIAFVPAAYGTFGE